MSVREDVKIAIEWDQTKYSLFPAATNDPYQVQMWEFFSEKKEAHIHWEAL